MARVVGSRIRSPFIPDPGEAWRAGCRLDAMLQGTQVPHPRGVFRGSHAWFNALDDRRSVEMARRLNRHG